MSCFENAKIVRDRVLFIDSADKLKKNSYCSGYQHGVADALAIFGLPNLIFWDAEEEKGKLIRFCAVVEEFNIKESEREE